MALGLWPLWDQDKEQPGTESVGAEVEAEEEGLRNKGPWACSGSYPFPDSRPALDKQDSLHPTLFPFLLQFCSDSYPFTLNSTTSSTSLIFPQTRPCPHLSRPGLVLPLAPLTYLLRLPSRDPAPPSSEPYFLPQAGSPHFSPSGLPPAPLVPSRRQPLDLSDSVSFLHSSAS